MRLFVALQIASAVRDEFAGLMNDLRALEPKSAPNRPRWVHPDNLHVTLKFIGEVAPEKLAAIRAALGEVHSAESVQIRFRSLGFFPNPERPRVLWAGITGSEGLASIAAEVDQRLSALGFPAERRAFTPHLTLARFEPPVISAPLRAAIENEMRHNFGELRTNEFHLIESKLKPTGAEYTTLETFLFAAET